MSSDSSESHETIRADDSDSDVESGASNLDRLARAFGLQTGRPGTTRTAPSRPDRQLPGRSSARIAARTAAATGAATSTASSVAPVQVKELPPRMAVETPKFVYRQGDLPLFDIETDKNEAFHAWKVKWEDYYELSYLSTEPPSRQVRVLRRCMSSATLTVLQSLGISEDPADTTVKEIIEALRGYVARSINVNIEWNNLMSRFQAPNEPVDDYVLALRQIVKGCDTCGSTECAERAVRVQLVRGVRDQETTKELLKHTKLTLEKAVEIARSNESAKRDSTAIHKSASGVDINRLSTFKSNKKLGKQEGIENQFRRHSTAGEERHSDGPGHRQDGGRDREKVFGERNEQARYQSGRDRCPACGRQQHEDGRRCPAYNERCNFCGKIGHFKRMCRARKHQIAAIDAQRRESEGGDIRNFERDRQDQRFAGALSANRDLSASNNFEIERYFYHVWVPCLQSLSSAPRAWVEVSTGAKIWIKKLVLPDTGADITAVDKGFVENLGLLSAMHQSDVKSAGTANGTKMKPIGAVHLTWRYRDKVLQDEAHVFMEVTRPLLSWRAAETLGLITYNFARLGANGSEVGQIEELAVDRPDPLTIAKVKESLLSEFSDVFSDQVKCMKGEQFKILLTEDAVPFRVTAPRAVPLAYKEALQYELNQLQLQDIIEPVTYPTDWCSPIVVEPKGDGVRLCVDFTKLNKFVRREFYTVEPPAKQVAAIAQEQAQYFSSMDAVKGYHQCPLQEESRDLTTFITPFGRFRYKRAPFGLSSISEHYNRRMDECLKLSPKRTRRVVDDLAAFDRTFKQHLQHIRDILLQCRAKGITLSTKKFRFAESSIKFAGFVLSRQGYSIDPEITKAISQFPVPKSITDVRAFVGLVNQLSGMRSDIAMLLEPIRPLLSPKNEFLWTDLIQDIFEKLRVKLCERPIMAFFDLRKSTRLLTDASRMGLGFVLQQYDEDDKQWHTVQAGSRSLNECEKRYAVIELEMLAVCFAVRKTITFTTGIVVTLVTDHRPLVPIINDKRIDEIENPRLRRMRQHLAPFQLQAVYLPGKQNQAADALSRYPVDPAVESTPLVNEVCAQQPLENVYDALEEQLMSAAKLDDQYQQLKALLLGEGFPEHKAQLQTNLREFWQVREALALFHAYSCPEELLIYCGRRALIPRSIRPEVIRYLHAAHQGTSSMLKQARQFVYWPHIDNDIDMMVKECTSCARYAPANSKQELRQPELPRVAFADVSMDVFQIGQKHFLAIVDAFSGWPELVCFNALVELWARVGIPFVCRSDNGPQFGAKLIRDHFEKMKIIHITSAPYYAQSNGRAEAAVKVLKNIVKRSSHESGTVIDHEAVSAALLAYRNTPGIDGLSPAAKVYGRPIRGPVSYVRHQEVRQEDLDEAFLRRRRHQDQTAEYYNRTSTKLKPIGPGDQVWIRNPRTSEFDQTGTVISMENDGRRARIQMPAGAISSRDRVHIRPKQSCSDFEPSVRNGSGVDEKREIKRPKRLIEEI